MKSIPQAFAAVLLAATLSAWGQATPAKPSAAAPPVGAARPEGFNFPGGTLRDFVAAVKKHSSFDLLHAATIDEKALNYVQVPKMKIPGDDWDIILSVYNRLSEKTENNLGRWVKERSVGAQDDPAYNAIVFLPPRHLSEKPPLKVKAFSLDMLKPEDVNNLRDLVAVEARRLEIAAAEAGRGGEFDGQVNYHPGTGLLIASGGAEFVELASTIVEAFKETLSRRRPQPPSPPPGPRPQ